MIAVAMGIFSQKQMGTGKERRKEWAPTEFQDRRGNKGRGNGQDGRKDEYHKKSLRIPIFIKLATLSTLLILFSISAISYSMLRKQREQFIGQLMNLGQSMVHIVAKNAPDKLLGEEDLALFKLVNDIAENEQVLYALIIDAKNIIRAHSRIEEVGKAYVAPKNIRFIQKGSDLVIRNIIHDGVEVLFFESPITYQKIKVGEVHIAISQKRILENIREAKIFIFLLTLIILFLGILLSLGLSMYFSSPIKRLGETTKALGMGRLNHRVRINRNDEFGDLAYSFNRMAEDLEVKEKIKDSFGQYVTPEVVDMILNDPDMMKGSKIEATVLFVDIRGFTSLSEGKEPEGMVALLNEYFTRVTDVVNRNNGHINKFAGDEAVAVFGAPLANPQHALTAVKAALEIQEEMAKLNRGTKAADICLEVGVGINSGEMVAGSIGSEGKREYTVIGDSVNVGSRLTSLAKGGEILITKRTYQLIGEHRIEVEAREEVPVKGRKKGIRAFRVLSLEEEQDGGYSADGI